MGGRSRGRLHAILFLMTFLPFALPSSPPTVPLSMELLQASKVPKKASSPPSVLTAHASAILLRQDALAALLASLLPRLFLSLLVLLFAGIGIKVLPPATASVCIQAIFAAAHDCTVLIFDGGPSWLPLLGAMQAMQAINGFYPNQTGGCS